MNNELIKYKEYCIWPYNDWDVIEVLIAEDIEDWYIYDYKTEYYYIKGTSMRILWSYKWNVTDKILELREVKNSDERVVFWEIIPRSSYDWSYMLWHRKIDIENHCWWKPITKPREKLDIDIFY